MYISALLMIIYALRILELNPRHFHSTSALWKHLRQRLYLNCQERMFTDVAEQTEEGKK